MYKLGAVFIIRNARLLIHFKVLRDVFRMQETVRFISKPILNKLFFIYLIYYEYAYLGAIIFGGKLTHQFYNDNCIGSYPPFYWALNFNDFGASIIVLFS